MSGFGNWIKVVKSKYRHPLHARPHRKGTFGRAEVSASGGDLGVNRCSSNIFSTIEPYNHLITMRPTIYRTDAVTIMRELLENPIAAQCLTNKDIFLKMNEILGNGNHICYRTFQRYKAAAIAFGDATVEEQQTFDPLYQSLYNTILLNQVDQKMNLYKAMIEAEGTGWHTYKWILERKFPDFNLRKVSQQYVDEQELIERRMMELDLLEAEEQAKIYAQLPAEKTEAQQQFEQDAREEVLSAVPEEEKKVFNKYWDFVQKRWDDNNPITKGQRFGDTVMNKMILYYRNEFANWKHDKKTWLRGAA